MKTIGIVILSVFVLFSIYFLANSIKAKSPGEENQLTFLKRNFTELYLKNYSYFWEIVHEAAKEAQSCESSQETASFIELVCYSGGNAEFNEFYNKIIEHLCISNPKCFFDSLVRLDEESRSKVIDTLHHPIFVRPIEIEDVFSKNRNVHEYEDIIKAFFSTKGKNKL
jgi:hypothetical protein